MRRRRTHGRIFNRGQLARAALVVGTAAALCAAAVGLGRGREVEVRAEQPAVVADTLAAEFRRCNGLGYAALDDDGCAAAWAEHRRRFFLHRTGRAGEPPLPDSRPQAGRLEDE